MPSCAEDEDTKSCQQILIHTLTVLLSPFLLVISSISWSPGLIWGPSGRRPRSSLGGAEFFISLSKAGAEFDGMSGSLGDAGFSGSSEGAGSPRALRLLVVWKSFPSSSLCCLSIWKAEWKGTNIAIRGSSIVLGIPLSHMALKELPFIELRLKLSLHHADTWFPYLISLLNQ